MIERLSDRVATLLTIALVAIYLARARPGWP